MKIKKAMIIVKIFKDEVDYILPKIRETIENLGIKDKECVNIIHDEKLIKRIEKFIKSEYDK